MKVIVLIALGISLSDAARIQHASQVVAQMADKAEVKAAHLQEAEAKEKQEKAAETEAETTVGDQSLVAAAKEAEAEEAEAEETEAKAEEAEAEATVGDHNLVAAAKGAEAEEAESEATVGNSWRSSLLPDKSEFMLEYLRSYKDRAGQPNAGKVVYNAPDGVLNWSSGGPNEATTFRLHEVRPGAFKLEYVSAYKDRVPGNEGKFVYNQQGGNFQWTSFADEATVFKAVGDASDFILEICSSYKNRAGEPYSGKVVYNSPSGNLNYSSGGPHEASHFKVI